MATPAPVILLCIQGLSSSYLFILAALGLCRCPWTLCKQGLLFIGLHRLLDVLASLVVEHTLYSAGSGAVPHGLRGSEASGILPDQGWNPCPLHWQLDSYPLDPQGSPRTSLFDKVVMVTTVRWPSEAGSLALHSIGLRSPPELAAWPWAS